MSRALGLLIGYAADRLLGDPRRWHPVAGFGSLASRLERSSYADSRVRGAAHVAILVGITTWAGLRCEQAMRRRPLQVGLVALTTWAVLGGRSLEREAQAVARHLNSGELAEARRRLTHLVGRDTTQLSEAEVARAVVESVAENTSDAVVAPLLWGALLGVPGLVGYRSVNTLDAMIGHRSTRYERFGWSAARLDDVLNLPAARLGGLAVAVATPHQARAAQRTWRRDAAAHPSPNSGVVEAAFAGALGLRLGGSNTYPGGRVECRPLMGDGRAPRASDIDPACRLAGRVGVIAAGCCAALAVALGRLSGSACRPPSQRSPGCRA